VKALDFELAISILDFKKGPHIEAVRLGIACSFDHLVALYYRAIWRTLIELPDVVDQGLFSKVRLSSS
jgi:hypothetical protein